MTTSRRTPAALVSALRWRLMALPRCTLHVPTAGAADPGAYVRALATAECLVVTADSINMLSEAATSGAPMHAGPLPSPAPPSARL